MLEKRMKKKNFKSLVYLLGALIEVLGFGLLFAPDKVIPFITNNHIIIALVIIFAGYLMAISVRKRK